MESLRHLKRRTSSCPDFLHRLALTTIHPRFRLPASRLGSHPDIESIGGGRGNMLAIDIQSGLSEAWERIITFVPKFL
jgi:hypothetical protein